MSDLVSRVTLEGPVLVLLSGGRDSVCLLDCAVRLAGPVEALHVNYGLREEADGDEAFCRDLCERLGIPLHVHRPGEPSGTLQAWARDERYAAAERLAVGDIATGHTASDQVETVLYRLASSPGRNALLGMPARRGRIVRPLLAFTRDETTAHNRARGLTWVDDASNDADAFARNRVRHGLLEALKAIHPAAEANVLRTLDVLRAEAELLDELADPERLRELPPALQRIALQRLAGRPVDPEAVLSLRSGSLDLGGGVRAVMEHGRLRFTGEPPPEPVQEVGALTIPGHTVWGEGEIVCRESPDGRLDREALGDTVEVRAWRPGDRIRPAGLDGTKTLQDLFTDRKVPRESRGRTPVLVAHGEVAWVEGVCAERFRGRAGAPRVDVEWRPPC